MDNGDLDDIFDKAKNKAKVWWNHHKYLLRSKPKYVGEPTESEDMFCSYCGKPGLVRWLDYKENIGYGEEFYDGMHLECFILKNGHQPKIISKYEKPDKGFGNKPYEI